MILPPLMQRLADGDVVVADGALGTMLLARGLPPGDPPEKVTFEHPEWLEEIATAYIDAGAEIIQTNTFGASPARLAQFGLEPRAEELNVAAVRIIRPLVEGRAYLAASCGPAGLRIRPGDDADLEIVRRSFDIQLRALLSAGVDLISIETMLDLEEAVAAVETARRLSGEIPIMATMSFEATANGPRTPLGVGVPETATRLEAAGGDIIGANCGNGSGPAVEIAAEFIRHTRLPVIMKPNAGMPQNVGGRLVYPESPELMAEHAREMLESGVMIIGGCCGTTPEYIRALRAVVDQRKKR